MKGNEDTNRKNGQSLPVHKTNNERFNAMINHSNNARRIYKALMSVEPSVEQSDQMSEKRKIVIREIFAGLNVS